MQAMEFSKGREAALALVFVAESEERLGQEFRLAKAALLDWKTKHGPNCATVMFTITTSSEYQEAVKQVLERVYREEAELSPILQAVEVRVSLLNAAGKPSCEYQLGEPTVPAAPALAKPWWKFW